MALRYILKEGEPRLKKKSRIVTDFNERLHTLLDDMHETMNDANGMGLAAPQVGVLRRAVLIVELQDEPEDDSKDEYNGDSECEEHEPAPKIVIELINPELIYKEGEQTGNEGCLSLPGQYGVVTRPDTVRIKAQDRYGKFFEYEGTGMTARAICHEIDHLEGTLYTDIAERMLTKEEIDEMNRENSEKE